MVLKCLYLLLSLFVVFCSAHLGPDKAKQHSGFITINGTYENGAHLFYWLVEARKNPETAPLVFYSSGGPGCSSMLAALFELGPYTVSDAKNPKLHINPYSWTEEANLLFIDSPVGTGFSYAESAFDYVRTSEENGRELLTFMINFYEKYPQYKKVPFFAFAESYGPRWIASLSNAIVEYNREHTKSPIPLAGIGLGDGLLNAPAQWGSYITYAQENGWLDTATYYLDELLLEVCLAAVKADALFLSMYPCQFLFESVLFGASDTLGHQVNPYNWKEPCVNPPLCYNLAPITTLLNTPSVQADLNIHRKGENWTACDVFVHFVMIDDFQLDMSKDLVTGVLAADIPVLVYVGMNDIICNYHGQRDWIEAMQWTGVEEFKSKPFTDWHVNGTAVAGKGKKVNNLQYLEINNCGHLAPHDQPAVMLDLLKTFLNHKPFEYLFWWESQQR